MSNSRCFPDRSLALLRFAGAAPWERDDDPIFFDGTNRPWRATSCGSMRRANFSQVSGYRMPCPKRGNQKASSHECLTDPLLPCANTLTHTTISTPKLSDRSGRGKREIARPGSLAQSGSTEALCSPSLIAVVVSSALVRFAVCGNRLRHGSTVDANFVRNRTHERPRV